MINAGRPIESPPQRIGKVAEKAFEFLCPDSWRVDPLSSGNDVGLDYQVQIVRDGEYQSVFRLQLKGQTKPKFSQRKKSVVVRLKARTLNYYMNVTEPIMLLVIDLSRGNPREASGYYVWLHDQLKSIPGFDDDSGLVQQTYSIHIPTESQFREDLDVSEYLTQHIRKVHAAEGLIDSIASFGPQGLELSPVASVEKIATRIRARGPVFLDSLLSDSPTVPVAHPDDSFSRTLASVEESLKLCDSDRATALLDSISRSLPDATANNRAEYHFFRGRVSSLENQRTSALAFFKSARREYPRDPKYLVAWVEEQIIAVSPVTGPRQYPRLLRLLPPSLRHEVLFLRTKLLAGMGDFEQALGTIPQLPRFRQHLSYALVYTLKDDFSAARSACTTGIADAETPDRHLTMLYTLRARAIFEQLVGHHRPLHGDWEIPLTGPPGMDRKLLQECWSDCSTALRRLRRAGWPPEIQHLAEFLAVPAVALNHQKSILADLELASAARPHLSAVQVCLEHLAFSCSELQVALKAINLQPQTRERRGRLALLYYDLGDKQQCLEIVLAELASSHESGARIDPDLLAIGAASAYQLLDSVSESELRTRLEKFGDCQAQLAAYQFLVRTSGAMVERESVLADLLRAYDSDPTNSLLQGILLAHLDPSVPASSRRLVQLSTRARTTREIAYPEVLRLAQAHATLQQWDELKDLAEDSISRFGTRDRLVALKAVALESLGESSEALQLLEVLVEREKQDAFALRTYINIAVRCGFTSKARTQVLRMCASVLGQEQKELFRLLFNLEMVAGCPSQTLFQVAIRYGELVDRNDEVEEGVFLQMFLFSTSTDDVKVDDASKKNFHQRLKFYTDRFPESKVLRAVALPDTSDPSALFRKLEELSGFTETRRRFVEKSVRELHSQSSLVPFAWRPRNILVNVLDVFHLWEIAKRTNKDAKEYHLTMSLEDSYKRRELHDLPVPPLLDTVSLIILADLDLFDALFRVFERVAISKTTLVELQSFHSPFTAPYFAEKAQSILAHVKARLSSVLQPGEVREQPESAGFPGFDSVDHLKRLIATGQFVGFSDDVCVRVYYNVSDVRLAPICTLDLLLEAEMRGYLSPQKVATRLARLAAWNVAGVPISLHHFLATIPDPVLSARNLTQARETLSLQEDFSDLAVSAWDIRTPYRTVVHHLAEVIANLALREGIKSGPIAAIWEFWLNKVRFRTDVSGTPLVHLARSMVLAGAAFERLMTKDGESLPRLSYVGSHALPHPSLRLLWTTYIAVVALELGASMDEAKEAEAIQIVGSTLAGVANMEDTLFDPEGVLRFLAKGFVSDTADYSRLQDAYLEARFPK